MNGTHITDLQNQVTYWEIGGNGKVGTQLSTPTPDLIQSVSGSVGYTHSSGASISLGIGYTIPYTPLSINMNWNKTEPASTSNNPGSESYSTIGGQDGGWWFDGSSSNYMNQIGQELDSGYAVAKGSGNSPATVTYELDFVYDMYNAGDNGGTDEGNNLDPYTWTVNATTY